MSDQFNPRLSPNEEAVAEKARPAKRLPILCLDFDGVLHGYQSGWQGAAIIPDPPVPGAVQFLHSAVERFQVAIYSSRSGQPGGIDAMRGWLTMWLLAVIEDRREAEHVLSLIQWPTEKPAATVTIDDRAIQFTGEWPSLDEIADFKPWNKRPAPDSTRTGQGEATEEMVSAGAACLPSILPLPERRAYFREALDAALAARPAAPEAQGAEREGFTAGYAMACANIVNLHGEDTIAENVLAESGITLAEVKALDLTDYDMKPLRALFREIARKRKISKAKAAPPASSGQGGR